MAKENKDTNEAFNNLYRFDKHPEIVKDIVLENKIHKLLATHVPSYVQMFRFNVLHSLEAKIQKNAKGKNMSDKKLHKTLLANVYPCYKKFYEPREKWFLEQRKVCQSIRQYKWQKIIHSIKKEKSCYDSEAHDTPMSEPISKSIEQISSEYLSDSFDDVYDPNSESIRYSDAFPELSDLKTSTQKI